MNSYYSHRSIAGSKISALFICLLLASTQLIAGGPKTFISHDVFKSAAFLVNNSFIDDYNGAAVQFYSNRDHIKAYFTEKGVLYRLDAAPAKTVDKDKDEEVADASAAPLKPSLVNLSWIGANPHPQIIQGQKNEGYYTYLQASGSTYKTLKTVGYKTLTYKELYPGIDVQFSFPEKGGIKYNLIVHPGADLGQVRLDYTGDLNYASINSSGELEIVTPAGKLMEHAPLSYTADGKQVESAFDLWVLNEEPSYAVQFKLPQGYDRNQTLTVDPWMVAITNMASSNIGMDVDFDSIGNTYVYGAGASTTLDATNYFDISKYDVNGVIQWTFNGNITSIGWNSFSVSNGNTNYPGNFYVVKNTGKVYVSKGHDGTATSVVRLDATGAYDNFISATNTNFQEAWGLKYNCVNSTLLALGGGPSSNINMAVINANTGAIDTANVTHVTNGHQDIACGVFDNSGNLYVVMDGTSSNLPYTNTMYRVDPSLHNYTWVANSSYSSLGEEVNQSYWIAAGASSNWVNCLAANSSYLYYWDGYNIAAYNLNTGAKLGSTVNIGYIFLLKQQGGIAVDNCNNVYVGGDDGYVNTYTFNGSTFTSQTDIALPGAFNQDNVQDVKYNSNNNLLYLTGGGNDGNSFVGTMVASLSTGCSLIAATHTCDSATAHVSPTAGTIFTYIWTDSTGAIVGKTTGSTDTINGVGGLNSGKYFISVQGQSNCNGSSLIDSVIISSPATIISSVDTFCSASATATITGGIGPFTYAWSNGGNTQTVNIALSGTYRVTVSSSGGCSTTASKNINIPAQISASATPTNASCSSNGSATVSVTAGTGPFTFKWNNSDTSQTISVGTGVYDVTVYGSGGCTATASATVNSSGSNLTLSTSTTNAGCVSNGTAKATVTAGTGPYTYSWNTGSMQQTDSNLAAGTYMVTVTGAGGCSASATASVGSSGGGLSLTTASTLATCGNTNGSAGVTITTGNPPYTYMWSNGGVHDTIANVASGNYNVTVTGSGACSATASVSVSASNNMTLSTLPIATTCGSANGMATVTITVGTGPYTYSWSPVVAGDGTATISSAAAGTYTVTVTGSGGCTATASAVVAPSSAVALSTSSVNTSCGRNNGSASVTPTTGATPFTYAWSDTLATATISNVASGTYTVTVTDATGCSATAIVTINPSGNTPVTIMQNKTIVCSGDSAQFCAPAGYAHYAWNLGDSTQCLETTLPGNYYLTVTDNGGCTATSNHLSLTIYPQTPVVLTVSGDTLHAYYGVTYQWYFDNGILTGDTFPVLVADQSGQYYVVETDSSGCVITSTAQNIKTISGIEYITSGQEGIKIYPNPLQEGSWQLEVGEDMIGGICEIYDAGAKLVYKSEIKDRKSEIQLVVAQGVYLMRLYSEGKNVTLKLIRL